MEIDESRKIVAKVPDAQVMTDGCNRGMDQGFGDGIEKLGSRILLGWTDCQLYIAHSAQVKAGVAWTTAGKATNCARASVGHGSESEAPILGLYGGSDQGFRWRRGTNEAGPGLGSPLTIIVYRYAARLLCGLRASYRKEAEGAGAVCLRGSRNMGLPNPAATGASPPTTLFKPVLLVGLRLQCLLPGRALTRSSDGTACGTIRVSLTRSSVLST
jgi:hypothetical protein